MKGNKNMKLGLTEKVVIMIIGVGIALFLSMLAVNGQQTNAWPTGAFFTNEIGIYWSNNILPVQYEPELGISDGITNAIISTNYFGTIKIGTNFYSMRQEANWTQGNAIILGNNITLTNSNEFDFGDGSNIWYRSKITPFEGSVLRAVTARAQKETNTTSKTKDKTMKQAILFFTVIIFAFVLGFVIGARLAAGN
jgi:hypothetical protein